MNCRCAVALTVLVAASSPAAAEQSTPAGRIKIVTGTAFVIHETQERPARIGDVVYETDSLTTGPDGRIGVTLRDETRISLGPRSEVRLDRFLVLARRRSIRACPQGRSRPGDVCLGPDCEALARRGASRNTCGDRRRPRHTDRYSRGEPIKGSALDIPAEPGSPPRTLARWGGEPSAGCQYLVGALRAPRTAMRLGVTSTRSTFRGRIAVQ